MNVAVTIDSPRWYAVHTLPKQENRAESNLRTWNVETFLPRIRDARFNEFTGKPAYIVKPLFPGYLFARFRVTNLLHKVRYARGVHGVVCVGGTPASISDHVIDIITAQMDGEGFIKIGDELKPGTKVLIQAGPFKGFTGILNGKPMTLTESKFYWTLCAIKRISKFRRAWSSQCQTIRNLLNIPPKLSEGNQVEPAVAVAYSIAEGSRDSQPRWR